MSVKRWLAAGFAGALLSGATLAGTATPAAAVPSDCETSFGPNRTVSSLCLAGTGEHRINIRLQHFDPTAGPIVANGPWQPVGVTSTTSYPPHTIVDVWISKR